MKTNSSELFKLDGKPSFALTAPLALQHVVAMIVGCVTPALILSGMTDLDTYGRILLVQSSLIAAGSATLANLIHYKFIGSGLPVIFGVSFAYLPNMTAILAGYGLPTIFGAQLIGGCVAILVGLFVKQLRKFFPPLITGTVVFTIGLSLYPTAVNYMAGGVASPTYGSWQNWLVAIITLAIVVALTNFGKGVVKLASILIGMAAGYIISIPFGMVNFSKVAEAGFFQLPRSDYFGMQFEVSSCITMGLLFAINSVQLIGDFSATTIGSIEREPTNKELKGAILVYGFTNILGSTIGGLPTASYSQNVGIVTSTKVVSRRVIALAGILIFITGLFPKIAAVLTTIPQCVLGGATLSVFASIAMTGIKLVISEKMDFRTPTIVGLAAAMGSGISQANSALAGFPKWAVTIFGKSPVVIATIIAILLNIILPKEQKKN